MNLFVHELEMHVGSFLVVPCGQYRQTVDSPTLFTAYVYARGHWAQPFLRLPATNKVNKADALQWMCCLSLCRLFHLQLANPLCAYYTCCCWCHIIWALVLTKEIVGAGSPSTVLLPKHISKQVIRRYTSAQHEACCNDELLCFRVLWPSDSVHSSFS